MRSVRSVSIITLALLVLFDLLVLRGHGWDPQAFVLARDPQTPANQDWGIGYDGQWYYAIARDPIGAAANLDQPGYRYRRILFPVLVRGVSLGQEALIPWAMIGLNLAAATGCAALMAMLLKRRQAPAWPGLVLVFSLGFLFAIRTDLLEPLALALALAGWLAYETEKTILAIVLFGLAALTKEFVLTFPAALILWELFHRRFKQAGALAAGSFLPFMIWAGLVYRWFGLTEKGLAQSRFTLLPFAGLRVLQDLPSLLIVFLWVLLPALVAGLWAARDLLPARRSKFGPDHVLVLVSFLLIAGLPELTWFDPLAVLRTSLGMLAALLLWSAVAAPRLLRYAAGLYLPSGLVLALVPGMFL